TPPTEPQVLIHLTRAALGVGEGQQPAEAVGQALEQVLRQFELSSPGRQYLATLAAVVGQPEPAAFDPLRQAGQALLSTLATVEVINFALSLARLFDRHHQPAQAVALQNEATARLRQDDSPQAQQTLSVALYNQAGYLAQLERLAEAVAAMEEVVAIDERLGLADLEADRAALAQYRRRLAGEPDPPPPAPEGDQLLADLRRQLAQAPPAEQPHLQAFIEQVEALSPAEQAAIAHDLARRQVEAQADQVIQAALAAHQAGQVVHLRPELEQVAAHFAAGESSGSAYANLAQFIRAVLALLDGQAPEPVAPEYVERLAEVQRRLRQSANPKKEGSDE
ncbi:MAG TPA: hypothetical protein PKD98_32020, partial [Anaerolineae bacterium]|nr:hypothetical protein [Anaerolineae bacterium]